jgi:uncharacterized protein (DUF1330 family)
MLPQKEGAVAKGYLIVHINVSHLETYRRYADVAPGIVEQLGGQYTVDAGRAETVE